MDNSWSSVSWSPRLLLGHIFEYSPFFWHSIALKDRCVVACLVIRRSCGDRIMSACALDQARVNEPDKPPTTTVLSCPLHACTCCVLHQDLGFQSACEKHCIFLTPRHLSASDSCFTTVSCLPFFAYFCTASRGADRTWLHVSPGASEEDCFACSSDSQFDADVGGREPQNEDIHSTHNAQHLPAFCFRAKGTANSLRSTLNTDVNFLLMYAYGCSPGRGQRGAVTIENPPLLATYMFCELFIIKTVCFLFRHLTNNSCPPTQWVSSRNCALNF